MATSIETRMIREAVGVFDNADELEAAIDGLESAGFDRAELSLLAGEHAIERKLGHHYQKARDLEDNDDVPRTTYISKESIGAAEGGLIGGLLYVGALTSAAAVFASGGALAAAIAAALIVGGGSGLIGSALADILGRHHAQYIQDQLDHGGLLLWVSLRDAEHEKRAQEILKTHSAHDVHVHEYAAPIKYEGVPL